MTRKLLLLFTAILVAVVLPTCKKAPKEKKIPKVGPVKISPHPSTLEGKTVVLRWNGKYNGNRFLIRVGELIPQQVKNVKIIKLWEMDKSTAAISKNAEVSE